MRQSRFNEEQITGILREQEAGAKTVDMCRKQGSAARPSSSGRRSMVVWMCPRRGG